VTLFKGENQISNSAILTLTGYGVTVNGSKLRFDFQHRKFSRIEPIFDTHMYDSIYCYFDPRWLGIGFPLQELHIFCIQSNKITLCSYQNGPCEHISQSFSSQLGHIK
jgi:hypothetical protein